MISQPNGEESVESTQSAEHALGFTLPPARSVSQRRLLFLGAAVAVLLVVAFLVGYLPRREARSALVEESKRSQHSAPRVEVVSRQIGASDRSMVLPGSVQPLQETVLYPRASGFVRAWYVDIGDRVKRGQVLAVIDTPELDQELAQAEAQLSQNQASLALAKANRELATANLTRSRNLAPSGVVSQADFEQTQAQSKITEASVQVAEANIVAQLANSRRLMQLKAFAKVTAPFDGIVTVRTVEVGALVTAATGPALFKVAAMDPARVFVQVPQDVAPSVRPHVVTTVMIREYPKRPFVGTVTRVAGELDPATRTMNTEIRVPNGDGALMAGMYAQVALTLPFAHRVFELPATALMSDSRGQRLAVIDRENKLHLVPVVVERDNGPTVAIASGLQGSELVAKIGSAAFVEGMVVDAQPAPR